MPTSMLHATPTQDELITHRLCPAHDSIVGMLSTCI